MSKREFWLHFFVGLSVRKRKARSEDGLDLKICSMSNCRICGSVYTRSRTQDLVCRIRQLSERFHVETKAKMAQHSCISSCRRYKPLPLTFERKSDGGGAFKGKMVHRNVILFRSILSMWFHFFNVKDYQARIKDQSLDRGFSDYPRRKGLLVSYGNL